MQLQVNPFQVGRDEDASLLGHRCFAPHAGVIDSRSAEPQPKRADRGKLLVWKETKFVFVAPTERSQ
jgi:hypothetical protein